MSDRVMLARIAEDGGDRNAAIRSLIGACIGMGLGASPLLLLSFGVYLLPIVKDTGWDRATVASSIGPALMIPGLMSPLIGWLTNRFGPRRIIAFGFPLGGVALMALSTPTSAAMFAATMAVCGLLISGQIMIPYVYCVAGWFEKRRGLALGTMLAFTGVGLIVIPPIAAQLIAALGWRHTYLTFGVIVVLVGIPVARWLIVDPPAAAETNRAIVPGMTWRQAIKTSVFWLLMTSILLVGGAVSAGVINLNVVLVERGVSATRASFVMGLVGISMIAARLVAGFLFDMMRPQLLTAVICIVAGTAFAVIAATTGPAGVVVGAVLIGIGFGAEGDTMSYLISRAFGMRDFAIIFGIMFFAFTFGGGGGPILFAMLKARSGDYQLSLWACAAACGVATLLVLLINNRAFGFAGRARKMPATGKPQLA